MDTDEFVFFSGVLTGAVVAVLFIALFVVVGS